MTEIFAAEQFTALVRARRTSMLVERERLVAVELVEHLCTLAQWAPNHKRTWPWRFAYVMGDGRSKLGKAVADAMHANGDPTEKVAKARTKYLRAPGTLVVGAVHGDSPLRTAENRDAVAAGIQNILLGATASGLATYWGSCPKGANEAVAELCGFEAATTVLGLIYLGWPIGAVEMPERPEVTVNIVA